MSSGIDPAIGMMDGAYFTSRKEILDFFNDLLELNLQKIEQTASGAVACQLVEYMFPNSIPMKRVNWNTINNYEFVQNYKLLQAAFTKHRIQKYVDVDKLIRAKYQDNLEFCQWLKAFYDQTNASSREGYDASAIRMKGKGGKSLPEYFNKNAKKQVSRSYRSPHSRASERRITPKKSSTSNSLRKVACNPGPSNPTPMNKYFDSVSTNTEAIVADANLMKANADLTTKNDTLTKDIAQIEKERDFYFEKLRSVEMLLQIEHEKGSECDHKEMVSKLFKILYAPADEKPVIEDNLYVSAEEKLVIEDNLYVPAGEKLFIEDNGELLTSSPPTDCLNDGICNTEHELLTNNPVTKCFNDVILDNEGKRILKNGVVLDNEKKRILKDDLNSAVEKENECNGVKVQGGARVTLANNATSGNPILKDNSPLSSSEASIRHVEDFFGSPRF